MEQHLGDDHRQQRREHGAHHHNIVNLLSGIAVMQKQSDGYHLQEWKQDENSYLFHA